MQQEGEKKLSKSEVAIVAGLSVGIVALVVVGIMLMVSRGSERSDSALFGWMSDDNYVYDEKYEVDKPIDYIDENDDKKEDKKDDAVVADKYVFKNGIEAFEDNEEIFSDSCEVKIENDGFVMGGEDMEALKSLTNSYQHIEEIYEFKLLDYEDGENPQYLYVKNGASDSYPNYYKLAKDVEDTFIHPLSSNLLNGKDALYKAGNKGEIIIDMESSRMLSATAFIYEVESGKGMNVVRYDGEHALIVKPRDYLVNSKLPATDDNKTRVWSAFEAKKETGGWKVSRSYRYCAWAP